MRTRRRRTGFGLQICCPASASGSGFTRDDSLRAPVDRRRRDRRGGSVLAIGLALHRAARAALRARAGGARWVKHALGLLGNSGLHLAVPPPASVLATRSSDADDLGSPRERPAASRAPVRCSSTSSPEPQNIDCARIEAAITPKTKALLPVHFAGQPCDEDALAAIAKRARPQAHRGRGARARRVVPRQADRHRSATRRCSASTRRRTHDGEGGALVTDDDAIAAHATHPASTASTRTPRAASADGRGAYDVVEAGFKYNFTDLQAAIGCTSWRASRR